MPTHKKNIDNSEPAWVTYISPLRFVQHDEDDKYSLAIDDVNANSYNHGELCEVVTTLSLSKIRPLNLLVCLDGALAIPRRSSRATDELLDCFNWVLCSLLLGGIPCEAVDRRDVVTGWLERGRLVWPVDLGASLTSHLRGKLRMHMATVLDAIALHQPPCIKVSEFDRAFDSGASVLTAIHPLTPTFLLRGFTELRYHNYSNALSNLWICTEQLTSLLWQKEFLSCQDRHLDGLGARMRSLSTDNRTWSTSVRQELLFQTGAIPPAVFEKIFPARKARNNLVHDGQTPDPETVRNLFSGVVQLIELASDTRDLGILTLDLDDQDKSFANNEEGASFNSWMQLPNLLKRRPSAYRMLDR